MTDPTLAERLRMDARHEGKNTDWWVNHCSRVHQAADAIDTKDAEIARLTAALAEAEQERDKNGKLADEWADAFSAERSRTESAEARAHAAEEALTGLLQCEYESASHGLMDCIDNDGDHYQSQHLADCIARAENVARAALKGENSNG